MEMPRPGEPHKKLQALVGQWVSEDRFHPAPWDPKGGTARTEMTTRMDLDGFFVIADCSQEREGKVSYRGHGVFGYDPAQQKYTMHWFDVMGFDPGAPALGTWDGNKLCFVHEHSMGCGRFTYEFDPPDSFKFRMERSHDGKDWTPFMDSVYRRVPQ
jgi:hypothetical protein